MNEYQKALEALKGTYCPQWRKECPKVCPTCKWWIKLEGTNPMNGNKIESWDCAVSSGVIVQVDASNASRSAAKASEEVRNIMLKLAEPDAYARSRNALEPVRGGHILIEQH